MLKAKMFKEWFAKRMGHSPQLKLAHDAIKELESELEELTFDAEQVLLHGRENDAGNWVPKKAVLDNLELRLKSLEKLKEQALNDGNEGAEHYVSEK